MFLVPQHRAKRIFLVHMYMVESLHWHVAQVFDDGAVRSFHICESRAACRRYTVCLGLGNLRAGPAKRSSGARPGVAADQYLGAFWAGVKRQQGHLILLIRGEVLA